MGILCGKNKFYDNNELKFYKDFRDKSEFLKLKGNNAKGKY